jgi:hypothetical protein
MREIKFRGWSTYDGKWVYGYLTVKMTKRDLDRHYFIYSESGMSGWRVYPESVGEFTGCYDEAGKEMYEGDILGCISIHGTIADAEIVFHNGRFLAVQRTREKYSDDVCYLGAYKIIGNIYNIHNSIDRREEHETGRKNH